MFRKFVVGLAFALGSTMAFALPTEKDVQAAVQDGKYAQAESMMAEVVAARPDSAKAHYIYAEILAHDGRFPQAATETAKARELDPAIKFTDPEKFRAFERTLEREQAAPARGGNMAATSERTSGYAPGGSMSAAAPASRGGIPGWVWLVGLLVLAAILWRGFSRSRAAGGAMGQPGMGPAGYGPNGPNNMPMNGGPGTGYQPGYQPGYGPNNMPMQRPGGGLLGTGLAVAGGVAGGMLLDQALHHNNANAAESGGAGIGGLGGVMPGGDGNSAASDLENRSIDFGNGNDWGGDSGGGGFDVGGDSGGGSDGGW